MACGQTDAIRGTAGFGDGPLSRTRIGSPLANRLGEDLAGSSESPLPTRDAPGTPEERFGVHRGVS